MWITKFGKQEKRMYIYIMKATIYQSNTTGAYYMQLSTENGSHRKTIDISKEDAEKVAKEFNLTINKIN